MEQGHYNRKQRKNLAKNLGLKKKNESMLERQERVSRSIEAGKQIHQQFLMQVENNLRNQQAEIDAKHFQRLVERVGLEEATRITEINRQSEIKRQEKLLRKKNNK